MPSPKTHCRKCGTEIMQVTADLNDGCCMPCVNAGWREGRRAERASSGKERLPLLDHRHPAADVMLSAAFHPGWCPDLTSWVIQISEAGELRQAVSWWQPGDRGTEEELPALRLDSPVLGKLRHLLADAEALGFRELGRLGCVDDAAMISLRIPRSSLLADVALLEFQHKSGEKRTKLTEEESIRLQLFGNLWRLADQHAPYRLGRHGKRLGIPWK